MSGITVLVPTRERPKQALETLKSFDDTAQIPETRIVLGIDYDEPYAKSYLKMAEDMICTVYQMGKEDSGSFQKVLNGLVREFDADIYGSIGDDHRFRTAGWDAAIREKLRTPGIAYANDLYMRDWLPTAAFISREIVVGLGWLALPYCDHLYIDNAWKDIGKGIGNLRYLPDVIIEHMHYTNNKSRIDHRYMKTNAPDQFAKDQAAYERWLADEYPADIERLGDYLNGLQE